MLCHHGNLSALNVGMLGCLNFPMYKEAQDAPFVKIQKKKNQQKSQMKRLKRS
jgi:hypothetical protein